MNALYQNIDRLNCVTRVQNFEQLSELIHLKSTHNLPVILGRFFFAKKKRELMWPVERTEGCQGGKELMDSQQASC